MSLPKVPMQRPVSALSSIVLILLLVLTWARPARADKIRDLCDVVGVRDNQLLGYGVLTGLNGTGDDASAPFAAQSLLALMRRLGVQIDTTQIRLKNVAAVLVTANIPPFARAGSRLDVTISSMGNAKSLLGGVLLQAPMHGADLRVYAVAQGPIVLGGFSASGSSGSSTQQNITTAGRVPNGALVEREIPTNFVKDDVITLSLRQGDFMTVQRMVEAINKNFGDGAATAIDGGSVRVKAPAPMAGHPVEMLAKVGEIDVVPSSSARVVINERTGTIIAGGDVRLAPVAIAQGGLTIVIKEAPAVSQPGAFGKGNTTVVAQSDVAATENGAQPTMTYLNGAASLADVARTLGALGVSPRELSSILQALKTAGALKAEIIMQ